MFIRLAWIVVVLLFLSFHGRADTVTLDLTPFDVIAQPIPIGDYFDGGTVINGIGQPITGPNYGLHNPAGVDASVGAYAFPHVLGFLTSPPGSLVSDTGFTALSFNWVNNPQYIPPDENFVPPIFFYDANGNPIDTTIDSTFTSPTTGFESISSSATAYSVSFGDPRAMSGRAWGFADVTFDLVSLPNTPSNAPEPASYALIGLGFLGIGLL